MKKLLLILITFIFLVTGYLLIRNTKTVSEYGAPPYLGDDGPDSIALPGFERFPDLLNWKRPEGPLRVGLQAGHWKNSELPDELERIRGNTGSRNGKVAEWEVNLAIAEVTKKILETENVVVDILPATIPPSYWADAFVAIHADGSTDSRTSGFKVAGPRRDYSGRVSDLVRIIEKEYQKKVGFEKDPNITRNMRGYYAFSWWRFEHAVHPMTPSVILETGFLTNSGEASVLINNPEIPAQALAEALLIFLEDI